MKLNSLIMASGATLAFGFVAYEVYRIQTHDPPKGFVGNVKDTVGSLWDKFKSLF